MKGQKLFIRPLDESDAADIAAFLVASGSSSPIPACGLLGRVVGDLVAVLAMRIAPDAVQIDDIVVATHLRRKRIARALLDEAEQLAAKMDKPRLVMAGAAGDEFLRRVGFEREGERWIRHVRARHG